MKKDINKMRPDELSEHVLSNWHRLNEVLLGMTASTVRKCLVLELAGRRRLGILGRLHTRFVSIRKKELEADVAKFTGECERMGYGVPEVEERLRDFYVL